MGFFAAALLSGALWKTLVRAYSVANPVVVLARAGSQTVAENGRSDPIAVRLNSNENQGVPLMIERIGGSGEVQQYTRIGVRLAELDNDASETDQEPKIADSSHDESVELPELILSGSSRFVAHAVHSKHALSSHVLAYSDAGSAMSSLSLSPKYIDFSSVPRTTREEEFVRRVIVARAGDTVSGIISALGAREEEIRAVAASLPGNLGETPFAGGETLNLVQDRADAGNPPGHVLKVTVDRLPAGPVSVARADDGSYQLVKSAAPRSDSLPERPRRSIVIGSTLRQSLHALARPGRVTESVVAELVQLCARDFDLDRPLDASDSVDLVLARSTIDLPELTFAEVKAQGRKKRYYRFKSSSDENEDFFDEGGRSATKFLLRKPVLNGRLGDGFGWRTHPVLHDRRFHQGVDYAAPVGSSIIAAGEGVVEKFGEQWGYGKYVRIRHDLGYETTYAHVAGFPKGLQVGDRVRQGDTVAFIGSTGLSTGPHLYYEVRVNGRNVDPLRVRLPAGRVLQGDDFAEFQRSAHIIDDVAARSVSIR